MFGYLSCFRLSTVCLCCDFGYYIEPGQKLFQALSELKEREEDFVIKYYRDRLTLDGIGKVYNLTRERVRQILYKALRKIKYMILRNERQIANDKREEAMKQAALADFNDLQTQRRAFVEALDKWGLLDDEAKDMFITEDYKERRALKHIQEKLLDKSLEEYQLSVRSYNVLRRAGLNSKNKVIEFIKKNGEDWYMKLRNCGRKSKREIEERFGVEYE